LVGYDPPLNAVMMLWVNLIMDTMGALALGTEPPKAELLDRRPYRRDASLISRPMWRNIFIQATYQLALLVFLLNKGPQMYNCEDGSSHHFTIVFNAFVFMQVFNQFNARKLEEGEYNVFSGLFTNIPFIGIVVLTIVVQLMMVEFGGKMVKCWPLNFQ